MRVLDCGIADALDMVFDDYQTSGTEQTEWVRRLVESAEEPTDEELVSEIVRALTLYCPNLPDSAIPQAIGILMRRIRWERDDPAINPY